MNTFPKLTDDQIRGLAPEAFRSRLDWLDREFSRVHYEVLTPLALAVKQMKMQCRHVRHESRPHAKFCLDCGEYYNVDTSFSRGV